MASSRDGSGTAWLPELSPMRAVHAGVGQWQLMLHGEFYAQYLVDGSERGLTQFGSVNWFMGMARRQIANGWLTFRGMFSLDRFTVGLCGYPDLLATGELCHGLPLHDQQHPHNLFMELAANYDRTITGDVGVQVYGGVAGEPALGPVAFMHRPSALSNPLAPITHHWLDATHITFGVVTAGVYGRWWKLEGSLFNGREPGEERLGIHLAPMDSYSGRLSLVPGKHWSFQVSGGHLKQAEFIVLPSPSRADVNRLTASLSYHRMIGRAFWATTAAWGRNGEYHLGKYYRTQALLLESSLSLSESNLFFGRGERAEKQGEDLALFGLRQHQTFVFPKFQLGYAHQFKPVSSWRVVPGLGASMSLTVVPAELDWLYVQTQPLGFAIFASLRPAAMDMSGGARN